ncbi:MAG: PQQ-like beta-propeller repeat protein [Fimbriimonadaceae bacterium]|nr:PQQ-like beta-propeller repeat protein [Fimbriimonadaceae bacterium]QYK54906.1 MAG: PQQ-like beta-propeller repeat protein [Fimbriimonadaceae bacterium]
MRILVSLVLLASSVAWAQLADWPVAVGGNPSRNGLSAVDGPTAPNLVWTGGLSAVIAQQGVAEGDNFVVARIFNLNDVLQGTAICCYRVSDGTQLWQKSLPVDNAATDWRNKVSAVRNGVVYATRAGNTNGSPLYALRISDGSVIWRSADLVDESSTESLSFTPDDDIIAGNFTNVKRIRASDGTTAWTINRASPTSDGSSVAVFGNRGYTWEAGAQGPRVVALDLANGTIRFRSPGIVGGIVQQVGLFVGRDGTVYAPRTQNNPVTDFLVAFQDTGSDFLEKWRFPMGYAPFASHAVGPDGSIYAYARSNPPTIVRLDPTSGAVLSASPAINTDFFQPRIAVDAAGRVFFTNGGFSQGAVYSFNPDLSLRWTAAVPNVNLGGPVICADGTLIVCGTGTNIRAYRDPQDTLPSEFQIFRGALESGGLQELLRSDDTYLTVRNGPVLNLQEAPIAVDVRSVSPSASPSSFEFTLETRVSTTGLLQETLLYDWSQGRFVLLDSRAATAVDTVVTVPVANPAPYIEAGTRRIAARVQFRKTGPTQANAFRAFYDRLAWRIR